MPTHANRGDDTRGPAAGWRIETMGDSCLIIEFGTQSDPAISRRAAAAAVRLRAAALPGVYDVVPALTTVGLHYSSAAVRVAASASESGTALPVQPCEALARQVEAVLAAGFEVAIARREVIDIPVCYGGAHGPDLEEAAAQCRLTSERVVELHTAEPVTVLTLGFAPGLPYLGNFDPQLALPRRASPRTAVLPGTVGLANRQSVIYPLSVPGGWSLIGRTPLTMFDPYRPVPCLLQAGDRVRFRAISTLEFDAMKAGRNR
jgi:KipI family sensor histidine kinase inhibitor